MKLCTFTHAGRTRTGIIAGAAVVDTGVPGTMIDLIRRFDDLRPGLEAKAATASGIPLAEVRLEAPVQRPGKIFAIGLNYADHIAETGLPTPQRQVWFTKAQTSVNAPFDPILIARGTATTDYEAELVAVIGSGGKHIAADDAPAAVFGYTIGNDVTERTWQRAVPQWALGKSFDTHAPMGPWIVTADELGDPHDLPIRCFVNGEARQDSRTRNLVHDVWQQIAHLSAAMTLEPGDCLFTGTPAGVGAARNPPLYLKAGDVLRTEIGGIGHIEATMAEEN